MSSERACSRCGVVKSLDMFPKSRNRPDGHFSWCKACSNAHDRQRYLVRKHTDAYKKRHLIGQRKYIAKNPQINKAHYLARDYAVKKSECEKCGSNENLHMHHPDYSKPLEVVTLCVPCHEIAHHGVIV